MNYILKAYCISEFGQRKDAEGNPHQEDSVYPAIEHLSNQDRTFILCDGMGGHDAGEVASSTVCETMGNAIATSLNDPIGIFTTQDFQNALNSAFDALDDKDNGSPKKMGTTMTFLKLHDKGATIAHIGDSRVYHIRPGLTGEDTKILFETEDHSLINDLIKVGELTPAEARYSKQKNVITRAMQPHMDRRPNADIHQITDIKPGDYFYMCSDGMLEQPEMEKGLSLCNIFSEQGGNDENKIRILKSVTNNNRDNHTAFIIHILEVREDKSSKDSVTIPVTQAVKKTPNSCDYNSQKKINSKQNHKNGLIRIFVAAFAIITIILCYKAFKPITTTNQGMDDNSSTIQPNPYNEPTNIWEGDKNDLSPITIGSIINDNQDKPQLQSDTIGISQPVVSAIDSSTKLTKHDPKIGMIKLKKDSEDKITISDEQKTKELLSKEAK